MLMQLLFGYAVLFDIYGTFGAGERELSYYNGDYDCKGVEFADSGDQVDI